MEDHKRRRIADQVSVKILLVHLPMEILCNIVLRLPIQSILSCKSVCKALYAMILSPSFVKQHQRKRKDREPSYLVVSEDSMFLMDETRTSLRKTSFLKIHISHALDHRLPYPKIVAAFDGLCCIASTSKQDPVFLCNPVTTECIVLPMTQLKMFHQFDSCIGLGLDSASGQYKVVRGYKRLICREWVCSFQILTVGDVSWKQLEYPGDVYLDTGGAGVYWNGAIHWKARTGRNLGDCILAVDLTHEKIFIITYPGSDADWYPRSTRMAVLDGRLCLAEQKEHRMKIWEVIGDGMEEYCIQHKVSYDTSSRWSTFDDYNIITRLDEETILLQVHCRSYPGTQKEWIVEFNQKTGGFTFQDILSSYKHFETMTFEPSLASPIQPWFPTIPTSSMDELLDLVSRQWEWGPCYPYFRPGIRPPR